MRKDKTLSFATTWKDLENGMLSAIKSDRKSQEPYGQAFIFFPQPRIFSFALREREKHQCEREISTGDQ